MKIEMLEAIIRIRSQLSSQGKCCINFVPNQMTLDKFNSKNMYSWNEAGDKDGNDAMLLNLF